MTMLWRWLNLDAVKKMVRMQCGRCHLVAVLKVTGKCCVASESCAPPVHLATLDYSAGHLSRPSVPCFMGLAVKAVVERPRGKSQPGVPTVHPPRLPGLDGRLILSVIGKKCGHLSFKRKGEGEKTCARASTFSFLPHPLSRTKEPGWGWAVTALSAPPLPVYNSADPFSASLELCFPGHT